MGFLENLLKREARKVVSEAVGTVFSELTGMTSDTSKANSTTVTGQSMNTQDALRYGKDGGEQGLRQRLEYIVATEWSGYELRKDIPAGTLGAEAGARDYTYGLYLNGQPKAMIMLIRNNNHYRRSDVVKANAACQKNGIPYMNFMTYMANCGDYISNRLNKNIAR